MSLSDNAKNMLNALKCYFVCLLTTILSIGISAGLSHAAECTITWTMGTPAEGYTLLSPFIPYQDAVGSCGPRTPPGGTIKVSINGRKLGQKDYTITVPTDGTPVQVSYYLYADRGYNLKLVEDDQIGSNSRFFYYEPDEDKDKENGDCEENGTNPIHAGSGNKFQVEVDYVGNGPFPLEFKRYYNSHIPSAGLSNFWYVWNQWRTSYDRTIAQVNSDTIKVRRPNGRMYIFTNDGSGNWVPELDVKDRLYEIPNGFQYVLLDATIETYDSNGVLQTISRYGITHTLTYDSDGKLSQVSDPFGRTLQFTYDSTDGYLETVTAPGSQVYTYAYDINDNLSSVTYPNGKSRQYLYTAGTRKRQKPLLTGIIDENGNQFATWTYDGEYRAISSEHAGGTRHYNVVYNTNSSTTITDPFGQARTYTYSLLHYRKRLTSVSTACDGCGGDTPQSISYDANGFRSSETDFEGNVTNFVYNDRGLQTSRTEAVGTAQERTITTQWHPTFGLPTLITDSGRTISRTYDADGKVLTHTITDTATSQTRTWTYTYNAQNLLETIDGPRTDVTDVTTYSYDTNGNLTSIALPESLTITITAHDADGRPTSVTFPNGLVVTATYDFKGRLLTLTEDSKTTTYAYNDIGKLSRVTRPSGAYLDFTYDNAHRLTKVQDNLGNYISYTLDNLDNVTQENTYDSSDTLKRTLSRTYNQLNRLAAITNSSSHSYDYTYDNNGQRTGVTDPNSKSSSYQYDALKRLVNITDPATGQTQLAYDALDRLTGVTDAASHQTTYAWDGLGNLTQRTSPDTGTTAYTYDAAGNRITRVDGNSVTTTYSYDALNRNTGRSFPDSAQNITYTYDQGTTGPGYMTAMTDPSGSYQFTFDLRGNMTQDSRTILGVNYITSYTYDDDGKIATITYPSGRVVEYLRDAAGRITTVRTGGTQIVVDSVTHLPFGPINSYSHGNGAAVTRIYNQDYWPTALTVGSLVNLSYTRGNAGNTTGITDNLIPGNSQAFGYDDLYRLTSATGVYGNLAYTYDVVGNRLSKNHNGSVDTYAYGTGNNKLASITGANPEVFGYDNAGNVTSRANTTFDYNQNQRMIRATVGGSWITDYVVNGLGQRVIKTQSTNVTVYHYNNSGQLIAETDDTGTLKKEYIYMGAELVGVVDNGNLYHAQVNHRLEPIIVSNSSGVVVWNNSSLPFGQATVDEDPDGDSVLFSLNKRLPGQYYDSETSQHYNYFRDYYPNIGRYIQADPIGLKGGINLFAYVENNPTNRLDPLGLHGFVLGGRWGMARLPPSMRPGRPNVKPRCKPDTPPKFDPNQPPPDLFKDMNPADPWTDFLLKWGGQGYDWLPPLAPPFGTPPPVTPSPNAPDGSGGGAYPPGWNPYGNTPPEI